MSDASSLFGRESELKRLEVLLEQARTSRGSFVMLSGPDGVGKTALATEFARKSSQAGALALSATLDAPPTRPYDVWRQILATTASDGALNTAGLQPGYAAVLRRLCRDLSDECGTTTTDDCTLPPEQMRYRIYDAVREYLLTLSSPHPLLLVIDGAEWADEPSMRLLRHLLPFIATETVMILLIADDTKPVWAPIRKGLQSASCEPACELMSLRGIGASETAALPLTKDSAWHPCPRAWICLN